MAKHDLCGVIFHCALVLAIPWLLTFGTAWLAMSFRLAAMKCHDVSRLRYSYTRMFSVLASLPVMQYTWLISATTDLAGLELCDGDDFAAIAHLQQLVDMVPTRAQYRNTHLAKMLQPQLGLIDSLSYYDAFGARDVRAACALSLMVSFELVQNELDFWQPEDSIWTKVHRLGLAGAEHADQANFQMAVETLEQAIQLQALKSSSIALWPIAKQINMTALLTCRALCKFALGPEHDQDATESLVDLLSLLPECSQSGFFLALSPGQISLVQALLERKQYDLAERFIQFTYAAVRLNPHHPSSSGVLQVYEQLLLANNRGDEIADLKSWVLPISALSSG
ncbi:MAG: hypothetical protein Q8T09_01440 [Candidatus Melainabacteria bacterium]|nr:hypothetical protein [Candidatus Melainabacteria bacterium]